MVRTYHFEALDRWFFRGPQPFNAGETQWLASEFPPSARVVQGAVRSSIGEFLEVDWYAFRKGNGCEHRLKDATVDLVEQIGTAESLGRLRLKGPYLHFDEELLIPAPLDLYKAKDEQGNFFCGLLTPSGEVKCDLGSVRLPHGKGKGIKTFEGRFVTRSLMMKLLQGNACAVEDVQKNDAGKIEGNFWELHPPEDNPKAPALVDLEAKIGLMRDNSTRRNVEGMLYGIALARPRDGISLVVGVDGIDDRLHPDKPMTIPLGGEGKLARLVVENAVLDWPDRAQLSDENGTVRFKLVLTVPARMPVAGWLPPGFPDKPQNGVWPGIINGFSCTVVSACIGKAVKVGGWNMASGGKPRPLQSFIPAGSVYFCEANASDMDKINELHDTHIGCDTEYGFGHVLVGTWKGESHE